MDTRTFANGNDTRTVSFGTNSDGTACVRQVSEGDLTALAFESDRHEVVITFAPTEDYGLADVADDLESRGADCFVEDFEHSLELWDVPFSKLVADQVLTV